MEKTCKHCGVGEVDGIKLEKHHIIPKSTGGSDNESNLLLLCAKCHGMAHGTTWDIHRNGALKEGIRKKKERYKFCIEELSKISNDDIYSKVLSHLDIEKAEFLSYLMREGWIDAENLYDLYTTGQAKIKINRTINCFK